MADSPVDNVLSMKNQGLSNTQIMQELQRQGFNPEQVFDAMNQADAKNHANGGPIVMNDPTQAYTQQPQQQPQQYQQYAQPTSMYGSGGTDRENVEEIAEEIIDEKWRDLVKNINKVIDWKNQTETKITSIEQEIHDLKKDFEDLHKAVIGKIGEYDQNILHVGTEIKAMEKVFQNVLPTFTENVNELSRMTKRLKTHKKKV